MLVLVLVIFDCVGCLLVVNLVVCEYGLLVILVVYGEVLEDLWLFVVDGGLVLC